MSFPRSLEVFSSRLPMPGGVSTPTHLVKVDVVTELDTCQGCGLEHMLREKTVWIDF